MIKKNIDNSIRIGIVVPFFNEIALIPNAIVSINSQIIPVGYNIEIVVVNDGDVPNLVLIELLESISLYKISIVNNLYSKGPGGARNTGIDFLDVDYIAFLDSDDFWLDAKLSSQIVKIEEGYNFCVTGYAFDNGSKIFPPTSINSLNDFVLNSTIGTSTVLVAKSLISDTRFTNHKFSQDTIFWGSLAIKQNFKYSFVSSPLVVYGTSGRTKNKFLQLLYYNRVLGFLGVSLFIRIYSLAKYIVRGLVNHFMVRHVKRFFDFCLSFFLIIFLSPIIFLGYLFSSYSTKSNGLFFHRRVGLQGELFYVYKLKTMTDQKSYASSDLSITALSKSRVTQIGSFLRKYKIDELPQLFNVFIGQMSFVGPRPDVEFYSGSLAGLNNIKR